MRLTYKYTRGSIPFWYCVGLYRLNNCCKWWENVLFLIWFFTSNQQFFSYVETGLPGLNQYSAWINVSCSRTQCSDASEHGAFSYIVLSVMRLTYTRGLIGFSICAGLSRFNNCEKLILYSFSFQARNKNQKQFWQLFGSNNEPATAAGEDLFLEVSSR